MGNLGRSISREFLDFVDKIQGPTAQLSSVSAGAFTKARAKLRHTAFIELNDDVLRDFYSEAPFKKDWKGFRVIAGDGSSCEVPNSAEVLNHFGLQSTRPDGKKICVARIAQLFDCQNNLSLAGKIKPWQVSESNMVWEMLMENNIFGDGDLFVFDRYFYSCLFVAYFDSIGADFCFRVKKNLGFVKKLNASGETDSIIEVGITKGLKEEAKKMGLQDRTIKCRLVKIELPSDEEEYLITSLTDASRYSISDLAELYHLRWSVEENFKKLKHRVCLENFSGKTLESVFQDYYCKLFMINLTCCYVQPIDHVLEKEPRKKHYHKVNFTSILDLMRNSIVDLFIHQKYKQTIRRIHKRAEKETIPIRNGRSFKRTKLPKTKHHMNYK